MKIKLRWIIKLQQIAAIPVTPVKKNVLNREGLKHTKMPGNCVTIASRRNPVYQICARNLWSLVNLKSNIFS